MEGGKLIGKGGYGCVFHPNINCSGKTSTVKKYVSKLQILNKKTQHEIEIGNFLKKPKYKSFFSPIIQTCNVDISTIKDKDKEKCTIKHTPTSKYILMKMNYINGETLIDLVNKKNKNIVSSLISYYLHLLKALIHLKKEQLIHFDLKGDNIMINKENKLPIIIDFGLSINVKKINKNNLREIFYIYHPEYTTWSLEIHYLSYLLHIKKTPTHEDLKNILKKTVIENTVIKGSMSEKDFEEYKDKSLNQLKKYKRMGYSKSIVYVLKYWDTWDHFSLSFLYLKYIQFLQQFLKTDPFIETIKNKLIKNIHPNPEERNSLEVALNDIQKILYEMN